MSLEGQVQELLAVLEENGQLPVTLIGWSWGAWLGFILASRYPAFVRELILIGSGPFEESYAKRIMETGLGRLSEVERVEALTLVETLQNPTTGDQPGVLARFGALMSSADMYDPLEHQSEAIEVHGSYDSHPYEGVKDPLSSVLRDFRFILLDECGHERWFEKAAKSVFTRF
jgi:pimeloyl-ACP methyl ester carboxylesterase